jgi:hypothetical protein
LSAPPIQRIFAKKKNIKVTRFWGNFMSKLCLAGMSHKTKCTFSIQLLEATESFMERNKTCWFFNYLQKVEISTIRDLKTKNWFWPKEMMQLFLYSKNTMSNSRAI